MQDYKVNIGEGLDLTFKGEVLVDKETKYSHLVIMNNTELGKILFLNAVTQLSEKDEYIYHDSIVHPAMLAHDNPKNVLVIGGGDGGVLREVFRYPVEKVALFELDPEIVDNVKEHFPSLPQGAFDDKRLTIEFGDGKESLDKSQESYDVIILDLTDPEGPSKYLFTQEFYKLVQSKLADKGIVVLDADSPDLGGIMGNIVKTTESVFDHVYAWSVHVPTYFMKQGFAILSNHDLKFMRDPSFIQRKMDEYELSFTLFDAKEIADIFTQSTFLTQYLSQDFEISTDAKPLEIKFAELR